MNDNLKEIFLNELKNNNDTPKQEIIKLAEELEWILSLEKLNLKL